MEKTKTARRKYAPSSASPRGGPRRSRAAHPFEFRLKAVKLRLEEGFSVKLIAEQLGINPCSIFDWIKKYRDYGEAGLRYPSINSAAAGQARALDCALSAA